MAMHQDQALFSDKHTLVHAYHPSGQRSPKRLRSRQALLYVAYMLRETLSTEALRNECLGDIGSACLDQACKARRRQQQRFNEGSNTWAQASR